MGNRASSPSAAGHGPADTGTSVFGKELAGLNALVTGLLSEDGRSFHNADYNFLSADACRNFTVVAESQLKRHPKVELQGARDAIYLLPREDVAYDARSGSAHSKDELCRLISSHYVRVLKLLTLVKQVYDLEHAGDNSLAGITWRNVAWQPESKTLVVSYCGRQQSDDGDASAGRGVDFSQLTGLAAFAEGLSPVERATFLAHMQTALDPGATGETRDQVAAYASCGDDLLPDGAAYLRLLDSKAKCDKDKAAAFKQRVQVSSHAQQAQQSSLRLAVGADNAVLHRDMCRNDVFKVVVPAAAPGAKAVLALHRKMKDDYVANLNAVLAAATRLVDASGGRFSLRSGVDAKTLDGVWEDVKRGVAVFYLQSVYNYRRLLEAAKNLQSSVVTSDERRGHGLDDGGGNNLR